MNDEREEGVNICQQEELLQLKNLTRPVGQSMSTVNVKVEHEPGCVTCVAVAVLTIALFSLGSCKSNIGSSI